MRRILLLSSERSGSNLLRRILDRTDDIAGPTPPHLLKAFGPYWPYLDWSTADAKSRLAELAVGLLTHHFSPWEIHVDPQKLSAYLDKKGWHFEHLFDYCHTEYARQVGKHGYFAKENNVFDFAFQLSLTFPEAQFVHLVRDPRDVALSFKRAPSGPKTVYYAAERWLQEQVRCLAFAQALSSRLFRIRYEDLLQDPEGQVKQLFEFLGLTYDPDVLAPDTRADRQASHTRYWENLNQPILQGNTAKYRQGLKGREIACIEGLCAPVMRTLGYELEHESPPAIRGYPHRLFLKMTDAGVRRLVYRRRIKNTEEAVARQKRAKIYAEIRHMAGFGDALQRLRAV